MYYVLFHYTKTQGKGWLPFSIESKVIKFLHESYEDIEVVKIIEVKAEHRLGLIVTEEYIISTLEMAKEPESLVQLGRKPDEILKEKKVKLKELEGEEPSAMEKIGDDIEKEFEDEELTPEQKTKAIMDDADNIIEREKKRAEQKKKGWELCTRCNSNRVSPWNKKGICSPCQGPKGTRPRAKEFPGL